MRKVIRLCHDTKRSLFAVCDDGTVWHMEEDVGKWRALMAIPQGNMDLSEETNLDNDDINQPSLF